MFRLLVIALVFVSTHVSAGINPLNVEIVRDEWGVPHIFGKTDAETTYGLAWATCEDDFATVQRMLLAVKGRLAETDGKGGAILDFLTFISGAAEIVDTAYEGAFSPSFKKLIEAYAQGLNDYAATYSEEVLRPGLFPVTPKDIVAQYILTNMLLTNVYLDIQKIFNGYIKQYEVNMPSGSNAIALNSQRTKDGKTYLAVNSHQPLEGMFSWYEAHLVSEEGLNILGGTFPGGMSIFHGTNPYLGWACTLNHPDLSDVFKLEMKPGSKLQYRFDGKWETLQVRKKTVKVKLGAIRIPLTKTFYWSKYGTTLRNKNGFYSLRFPANMEISGCEKLYEMNKASSFSQWKDIIAKGAFAGVNFIYADRTDTIFYVSNGEFAERNPKYNWQKVLPGNTSETLWQPVFKSFTTLPQVLNPESGYLVNTNNSCFDVTGVCCNPSTGVCDMTYGFGTEKNNRSIMAHSLLGEQEKFSYEEFKAVKYNNGFNQDFYTYGLDNAYVMFQLDTSKYPDLKDALAIIRQWNRQSDADNMQAALITFSMYHLVDIITARGTNYESNFFTEEEYAEALRAGKKHMLKYFGSLTVPLGQVQKHVRGNVELPVGGMPEVLAATITQPYKNGMRRTFVGESYIQLVRFSKDTVEIETVNAYGSSSKPGSKHYTDQMDMFVSGQLKPMTLDRKKIYEGAAQVYHPAPIVREKSLEQSSAR